MSVVQSGSRLLLLDTRSADEAEQLGMVLVLLYIEFIVPKSIRVLFEIDKTKAELTVRPAFLNLSDVISTLDVVSVPHFPPLCSYPLILFNVNSIEIWHVSFSFHSMGHTRESGPQRFLQRPVSM